MRVEFIELLRCPAHHAQAPLVTVAESRDGDDIRRGTLGCPVCLAEFPLRDGAVDLTSTASALQPVAHSASSTLAAPAHDAMRLAALLNAAEPYRRVALCGDIAVAGASLARLTEAHCLVINPPVDTDITHLSALRVHIGARLPLADQALHGLAVDDQHIELLADAVRVVQRAGRVVAPAMATIPTGLRELARDTESWVATVEPSTTAPVRLARAP